MRNSALPSASVPESIQRNLPTAEFSPVSAASLRQALARANLLDEPELIRDQTDPLPTPPLVAEETARSSLPLALAKANESRKFSAPPLRQRMRMRIPKADRKPFWI